MVQPIEPASPRAVNVTSAVPSRESQVVREFEAVLLRPMVDTMLPRGGAFGEATGSDAWRGMLVDALSDTLARDGFLGLGAPALEMPGGGR